MTITGAAITYEVTFIDCSPVAGTDTCPGCGSLGCGGSIFRGGIDHVAPARAKVTARCPRWIVQRLAVDKMSISAIARTLGPDWKTVDTLAPAAVRRLVCDDPTRLDAVRYIGARGRRWKHVRGNGDASFVSVTRKICPPSSTAPARLLDMVPGRSGKAIEDWPDSKDPNFRRRIQIVSPDGCAGYHKAAVSAVPQARAVMDSLHAAHGWPPPIYSTARNGASSAAPPAVADMPVPAGASVSVQPDGVGQIAGVADRLLRLPG